MTRHVEACEALAETLERAGRLDLAALCDRAAFWLDGSLDRVTLGDLVTSCRESAATMSAREAADQVVRAVQAVEQHIGGTEDVAKLQAVALIVNDLFGRNG